MYKTKNQHIVAVWNMITHPLPRPPPQPDAVDELYAAVWYMITHPLPRPPPQPDAVDELYARVLEDILH